MVLLHQSMRYSSAGPGELAVMEHERWVAERDELHAAGIDLLRAA
jgi:hypothetical protein